MSISARLSLLLLAMVAVACQPMHGQVEAYLDERLAMTPTRELIASNAEWCQMNDTSPFVSETGSFEFTNTDELSMRHGGGIDFASIDEVVLCPTGEQLRLVTFRTAPGGESLDSPLLTPDETYARFRQYFYETAVGEIRTINGVQVEIIKYAIVDPSQRSNGVIRLENAAGIVALWRSGTTSYALLDLTKQHLDSNVVERVVSSFTFK